MIAATEERLAAAVRDSRAMVLGYLASRSGGDLSAAEDALSEAVLAAMQQWSVKGIPQKPEAWLLQVARRRMLDDQRKHHVRERFAEPLRQAIELASATADSEENFPDERLKLLFVCAHPAIDEAARTPLMLQVVLGLESQDIASAFLVAPAAMAQRLVRAKAKIHAARIPFQVPAAEEWPERLAFVLDAIYAAFNSGWETIRQDETSRDDLAKEAIYLARALVAMVPNEPEILGLLSLMLHVHARQHARLSESGRFIPLTEQDAQRWSPSLIAEAESLLRRASIFARAGRFQIEAAIQSVHAQRASSGIINWPVIEGFYQVLRTYTTAIGARIGHALAIAQVRGAAVAMAELDAIPESQVQCHQPYWVARGHLLRELGDAAKSREAYQRAIGLTEDPSVRDFLIETMKLQGQ
ncbi:MAG: RNA polymerase sigma factor [Prosthecobacter sp.]